MSLKIKVGPELLTINRDHSLFVSDRDGQIHWPSYSGFFVWDTRIVSAWAIFTNGEEWELLDSGAITHFAAQAFLVNRAIATEEGEIPARSLLLQIGRSIAEGAVHEDIDITNHGRRKIRFNLEISIRCDFADISEVKSGHIVRRGRITSHWSDARAELTVDYRHRDFRRELSVRRRRNSSTCVFANGRLSFDVALAPAETWHTCLEYSVFDGKRRHSPPKECIDEAPRSELIKPFEQWRNAVLKIEASDGDFQSLYDQAIEDMAALRLPVDGTHHLEFVPAAGIPWFVALFGRDSLIAALQNALVYPDFARGALDVLGRFQARERDDYRDAEPGKIPHEMRYGELAHFRRVPHTPYYGTADATPLYLIVLHTAWRCTGDLALVERHLDTAERGLEWIAQYGDRDGDGFQEYETRSSAGYENQSWKDSGDAVVDPDGNLVTGPKATCELQGYVYDAWTRMAELYDALGKDAAARDLRARAARLYRRFNEVFWDEESGFYAYCLDGEKRKILTVASNPGHLLWSRIVPAERAGRVVARLLRRDMWSGWGVRTLSTDNPAYNPFSYQCGSVWPHDNGIIAIGFRQYGFAAEAARIARAIVDAGSFFAAYQMPELYAGVEREKSKFPVLYPEANVPQAWAAGSVFFLLQALIGFAPDAPRGRLYIDPALPDWLPALRVRDLRFGDKVFDLRFWRDGDETRFAVVAGDEAAVVVRPASCDGIARDPATESERS
ncbi:MAG TPA: glycogen debranching N-terminal domain-containing protein [Stellaceae bacterium]|nr:glycogen debranching N-terminal domain-containing protein [Stellaceae bacterium]